MKAIVQDRYGDNPDALQLQEIATPEPGPNAVLIEVGAASLFVGDWHIMAGLPYAIRPSFGIRKPKARVRGQDVAGTVVAIGPGSRFQPGEDVFGTCEGSFAEFVAASDDKIARSQRTSRSNKPQPFRSPAPPHCKRCAMQGKCAQASRC